MITPNFTVFRIHPSEYLEALSKFQTCSGSKGKWLTVEFAVLSKYICCCCLSLSHVQLFVTLWMAACPASLSFTLSRSLLKLTSIELVMLSNHLILCRPLLLLPSIFPSIRVFSSEFSFCMRWLKHWRFSISPSNEHSGLISFRIDWFDFLSVQGSKHMKVAQSCLTLCDPMDCTVHGIL